MHKGAEEVRPSREGLPLVLDDISYNICCENAKLVGSGVCKCIKERASMLGTVQHACEEIALVHDRVLFLNHSMSFFFLSTPLLVSLCLSHSLSFEDVAVRISQLEDRAIKRSLQLADIGACAWPLIEIESVVQHFRVQQRRDLDFFLN